MGKKDVARGNDSVMRGVYQPWLNPRRTAASDTIAIQMMLERKLLELSMNRFEWTGLPKEIDVRWLEMSLNFFALAVFFKDDEYDKYFAMRGAPAGNLNMLGNPTSFKVYGNDYYIRDLAVTECVPIWANYMRVPDWDVIRIYSQRIAEMDRTIEINSKSARRTKIVAVNENGRLTAANFNRQLDEGVGAIAVSDTFALGDTVTALDLGVDPNSIVNMHMLRNREWNEVMTLLGINNANQDKKERLVASEVSSNDDMVAAIRATNLNARRQACELIKEMYSLDVTVDYVTDMVTPELKDSDQDGVAENETSQKADSVWKAS